MGEYFKGRERLLLQEYFDLKTELNELKIRQRFRSEEDEINYKISKVEKEIIEILNMFNQKQLKHIIYMSLDIDYDNLVEEGIIVPSQI